MLCGRPERVNTCITVQTSQAMLCKFYTVLVCNVSNIMSQPLVCNVSGITSQPLCTRCEYKYNCKSFGEWEDAENENPDA